MSHDEELTSVYAGGRYSMSDTGNRQEWDSGATREYTPGKGRFDLLPMHAITRLAVVLEKGSQKYSIRNWENGMPLSEYYDSAMRHMVQYMQGEESEDHLGQALWNIACLIETEYWIDTGTLPEAFRDLPNKK